MAHPLLRYALACLACMTLVLSVVHARQNAVWVVLAETGGVHAEAGAVLRYELEREARVNMGACDSLADAAGPAPALIVTVGTQAFNCTLDWLGKRPADWERVPVLASLLPMAAYGERLARQPAGLRPVSAVVLDQPPGRQLALVRRALPGYARVGVIPGPQSRPLLPELEREASERGLRLVTGLPVDRDADLYPSLRNVLTDADVLLALPDTTVYHGASLRNILLTTYRARVPLVAFSAGYVKAGALAAVYSTPVQVGNQTATLARRWLGGGGMPPVQGPREFAVATNVRVAASLGLTLDDADQIAEDLRRAEGQR